MEIKKGDILVSIWGCTMTLVNFYKVESLTKTGKTVKLRKLESRMDYSSDSSYQSGYLVPSNEYNKNSEILTKRVQEDRNGKRVKIDNYETARVWNGKPVWYNSCD